VFSIYLRAGLFETGGCTRALSLTNRDDLRVLFPIIHDLAEMQRDVLVHMPVPHRLISLLLEAFDLNADSCCFYR
jgi:hypothetical protein